MQVAAPPLPRVRVANGRLLRAGALLAIGIVAVVCALLAQHPSDPTTVPASVIAASLVAILAAAVALPDPTVAKTTTVIGVPEDAREHAILVGLLAAPALVAVLIWSREPFSVNHAFVNASSSWGALLWAAGMIGALIAGWPVRMRRPLALPANWPWLLAEILVLIAIFDVAAALRLYHLSAIPEGVWFDEVDFANSAQLLRQMPFQPFGAFNVGHNPSLYFYAMALLLKLGGMTIAAVRLTSVLFGLLAVLAVYGIGRKVGGPALGLTAAAFLAIGQWAVDFSRFGMSNIAAPATIALGFLTLGIAMYRPRAFWFALAGVILGLSLLTYAGGFLAGGGVAFLVVAVRLAIDPSFRRAAWPRVLFLPLGLLVGAAPFLTALWLDPDYTLARERTVSIFTEYSDRAAQIAAIKANLRAHLLMFTVAGDRNGRHNLPGAPMLDAVTGACFLLGLGISLRRLHRWFYLLLLCWLGASMLGGILSLDFEAPQGARTVGAVAPIALIAALPLAALARLIWGGVRALPVLLAARADHSAGDARPRAPSWLPAVATGAAALAVCVPLSVAYSRNTDQYFVRQPADMGAWSAMEGQQAIIGREAAVLAGQGYAVRIMPSMAGDSSVTFTANGLAIPPFDTGVPVTLPVPPGGLALLIPVDYPDMLDFVHRSYPTAPIVPLTPDTNRTLIEASAVLIRPQDAAQNQGATATIDGVQHDHLLGPLPWPAHAGLAGRATIRATLLLPSAEAWRPFALRVTGARRATITLDGQRWTGATHSLLLGAGNHQLSVQASGSDGPQLAIEWSPIASPAGPPTSGWSALPTMMLGAPSMPTGGLLGLYGSGIAFGPRPDLARVDQTVDTYYQTAPVGSNFPFVARWLGTLAAPRGGVYSFKLNSTGPSQLAIDGHPVVATIANGTDAIGQVPLTAGPHTIRVDYSAIGGYLHCYLTWAPPGEPFAPIPPTVTQPAHG